ncbi:MAG TPA: hypothetical protein VGG71_04295, partial [Chitinophagaceae bacterium]
YFSWRANVFEVSADFELELFSVDVAAAGPDEDSCFIVDLVSLLSLLSEEMSRNFTSFLVLSGAVAADCLLLNERGLRLEQLARSATKAIVEKIVFIILVFF